MAARVKSFLNGRAPEEAYQSLMHSNQQFADFVNKNNGKSVEQIAKEYGLDINLLRQLLK